MRNKLLGECLDSHSLVRALHNEFRAGLIGAVRFA